MRIHALALAFFPQALRLTPDAAASHPTLRCFSALAAHAVYIGLFAYVLSSSQRRLILSRHHWVCIVAALQITALLIFPIMLRRLSPYVAAWLLLIPWGKALKSITFKRAEMFNNG